MKLLYAEDERSMSEAVVDILTYHNYTVDAVYDGQEALDYAEVSKDMILPRMHTSPISPKICSIGMVSSSKSRP